MTKSLPVILLFALSVGVSPSWSKPRASSSDKPKRPALFSQTSIETVWKRAVDQRKPMLVMFTSDNCMYCKKMLSETYGHPAIKRMLQSKTQTVLAHQDDYESLVKRLGIRGYPSSVLVSPSGEVLDFIEGYIEPKEFAQRVSPLLRANVQQARVAKPAKKTAER